LILFFESDFGPYETYKKRKKDVVELTAKKLKPILVSFLTNQRKPIFCVMVKLLDASFRWVDN
jgi:hypothetical protein